MPSNRPSPAIVPQSAVRRLPRIPLVLLCAVYVLAGFVGRHPWRTFISDADSFGRMWDMSQRDVHWLRMPTVESPHAPDAPLPYALGSWSIDLLPGLPAEWAARLPFVLLLVLVLVATWYAVYGLARLPQAQPVGFAFGGEAQPIDYARAMADGGLLALMACLGLLTLGHESSPALAQLATTALAYLSVPMLLRQKRGALAVFAAGTAGLALSGAPMLALLFGLGSAALVLRQGHPTPIPAWALPHAPNPMAGAARGRRWVWSPWLPMLGVLAAVGVLSSLLALWRWRLQPPGLDVANIKGMGQLMVWFGWPATPLAAWTLWRWRRHLLSPHLALPMWYLLLALLTTLLTPAGERSLLLGLPSLATLAAFALPTLRRSVSALIDWFTLLFFTGFAVLMWAVWFSLEYGVPQQPAANIARLLPGYQHRSSAWAVALALLASFGWCVLVQWRVGRHPSVIWKSLVLPAVGATLGWVLMMTLLLSPLDYGLSHVALAQRVQLAVSAAPGCVQVQGLSPGLVAALHEHGQLDLRSPHSVRNTSAPLCHWVLLPAGAAGGPSNRGEPHWDRVAKLHGPRGGEHVALYRRSP